MAITKLTTPGQQPSLFTHSTAPTPGTANRALHLKINNINLDNPQAYHYHHYLYITNLLIIIT